MHMVGWFYIPRLRLLLVLGQPKKNSMSLLHFLISVFFFFLFPSNVIFSKVWSVLEDPYKQKKSKVYEMGFSNFPTFGLRTACVSYRVPTELFFECMPLADGVFNAPTNITFTEYIIYCYCWSDFLSVAEDELQWVSLQKVFLTISTMFYSFYCHHIHTCFFANGF